MLLPWVRINGVCGGFLGGILTSFLVVGLGKPGTFLVLAVLFIICMVCITERSFVNVVKKGGDKAYQYAREDMDRRRGNPRPEGGGEEAAPGGAEGAGGQPGCHPSYCL